MILPKIIMKRTGIDERDILAVEVKDGAIILRPLKPRVVNVDNRMVEEIPEEEKIETGK
ncbi:hypothetical protein QPL79_05860 [Ignisphaera sp. 4213-co]|uniref:AbrB/MazE/SpoVT family DNA-binding domain-containing protein n=1 Tax=Ignisphaera cupida TaxID=3050454 RepID=A0ABD4Z9V9_9CREN|nr:hypothetical protein [Ignisphaera sp. 4213-co]MDK6028883.1 hypothetical protein [Ignisphaera sp. 4213-co]